MKKFLLLSFLLSLVVNSVQAVTWQNFVGNRYYDNGYYTPNVRYSNGNYYSLDKKIGKFGYSVQKNKKRRINLL